MSTADPIRLALVITELEPGGAERALVELATRIDRSRFSPVVYSLAPRPAAGKEVLVLRLADAGIPVHFLDLRRTWQFFHGVSRLAELLREQLAEIVQTFLFHANVVGAQAAGQAAAPHLLTGMRVADPRRWRTALERWATASAARHVCVSQSVADFYAVHGFAAEKLAVIPNGIDVGLWRNAAPIDLSALGVRPGRRVMVYVGRLDEQKGLPPLFQELPAVFRDLPNHDLLLAGDGPQREQLQKSAGELGIADRVHFLGWRGDVPQLLAAADVLLLPSHWEGMPNVILEAMAAGKPVVATRVHGVAELLGDLAIEQTAPLDEPTAFRELLCTLMRNSDRRAAIATRNQERAFQQFSIEFSVDSYESLYSKIARPAAPKKN
jgi:Glycosyltransferase